MVVTNLAFALAMKPFLPKFLLIKNIGLTGMDLLRLSLEISKPLKKDWKILSTIWKNTDRMLWWLHRQKFYYHNSFIIAIKTKDLFWKPQASARYESEWLSRHLQRIEYRRKYDGISCYGSDRKKERLIKKN